MTISSDLIARIAHLSHLKLDEDEANDLSKSMSDILDFIEQVNAYNLSEENSEHSEAKQNQALRPDIPNPATLDRDAIQKNAPATDDGLYLVPDVIDGTES